MRAIFGGSLTKVGGGSAVEDDAACSSLIFFSSSVSSFGGACAGASKPAKVDVFSSGERERLLLKQ